MTVVRRIRIKNRLAAFDGKAADEADFGKKIEHVIDRRQRREHPRLMRFGRQDVGGNVTIALAKQQLGQAKSLPRGTQTVFLQQRANLRRAECWSRNQFACH